MTTCRYPLTGVLTEAFHDLVQRRLAGSGARRVEGGQRLVDEAKEVDEVLLVWLEVEDPGGVLATRRRLVQQAQRGHLVGRMVVLGDLGEQHLRSVVQCHRRR